MWVSENKLYRRWRESQPDQICEGPQVTGLDAGPRRLFHVKRTQRGGRYTFAGAERRFAFTPERPGGVRGLHISDASRKVRAATVTAKRSTEAKRRDR